MIENVDAPQDMKGMVTDTVREFEERKAKRNNIIITGIPETEDHESVGQDERSKAENMGIRGKSEEEIFEKVLTMLHLHTSRVQIASIKRIPGRIEARRVTATATPKPRPILVMFGDREGKEKVMQAASTLNSLENEDPAWKDVYFNHDKTKQQRDEHYALRKERRDRMDKGETDLVIRDGKVVKKTPTSNPRPFLSSGRGGRGRGRGGAVNRY